LLTSFLQPGRLQVRQPEQQRHQPGRQPEQQRHQPELQPGPVQQQEPERAPPERELPACRRQRE